MAKKSKSTVYHDMIAKEYELSYSDPYWQLYHEVTWHKIKKYLPTKEGAKILDAGGGTGYWSRKLATQGFLVVCSDIAQKMLDAGLQFAKSEKLEAYRRYLHEFNAIEDNKTL